MPSDLMRKENYARLKEKLMQDRNKSLLSRVREDEDDDSHQGLSKYKI